MNEEEIIDYLKEIIQEIEYRHKDGELILVNDTTTDKLYYSIKGLLDLYNKEIQRNKDLEEIEKEHKEEIIELEEENTFLSKQYDEMFDDINYMIPISLVREKIEEYNKMIDATYEDTTYLGVNRRNTCMEIIHVLQELLEESEK